MSERDWRIIATVEELDALPMGSMVLDSDPDALMKTVSGRWRSLNDPDAGDAYYISAEVILPATVLVEGDADE